MKLGLFAICSNSHLSFSRVLFDSARAHLPGWRKYLCLADKTLPGFDPRREDLQVVESDALGVPDHEDFSFRYDAPHYNFALKPFMFRRLFQSTDLDAVIYLDTDIELFSDFGVLEAMLQEGASIVVTPHVTSPIPDDGKRPTHFEIQSAGLFNAGFLAMRRCAEADRFIDWWAERLRKDCVTDPRRGIHDDQKWCDFIPCFAAQHRVLHDPGCNVAYWNLHERRIARADGAWQVNGRPLVFFHFSGMDVRDLSRISKHEARYLAPKNVPNLLPLMSQYAGKIMAAGCRDTRALKYAYGHFDDGTPIHPLFRAVYREFADRAPESAAQSARCRRTLEELCLRPAAGLARSTDPLITELMYCCWKERPDLQAEFPLDSRESRAGFARWFEIVARTAYDLPDGVTPGRSGPAAMARLYGLARKAGRLLPPFMMAWAKSCGRRLILKRPGQPQPPRKS